MLKSRKFQIILGILLVLVSGLAFAHQKRITWTPTELKPWSIAPNASTSYSVVLNGDDLDEIKVVPDDNIANYVVVTIPKVKKGKEKNEDRNEKQVTVVVTITAPVTKTPETFIPVIKTGNLVVCKKDDDDDKKKGNTSCRKFLFADTLPVELTFSNFLLPPDPGEAGKATIAGIDIGGAPDGSPNGVRDDIDRFIALIAYPDSAKKRAVMTLGAKAQQDFMLDYLAHQNQDPNDSVVVARVLEKDDLRTKADYCNEYVLGLYGYDLFNKPDGEANWDKYVKLSKELEVLAMDTPDRARAFWASEKPLVATGSELIKPDQYQQQCTDLGFDPSQFPN